MGQNAMKPTIIILDSVHCKANAPARKLILPLLKYKSTSWRRNRFGYKSAQTVTSHLITGKKGSAGTFLTGLLPKIKKKFGSKIKIIGQEEVIKHNNSTPSLKGIKFRPDQRKALRAAKRNQRGIILMPTGIGKTLIALGIMSMFSKYRILFLCHTTGLITQTRDEIKSRLNISPYTIGGGYKADWHKIHKDKNPIVLSTIQSFSKIPKNKYIDFFDITLVDEEHHVNSLKSQYGDVMINNLSPRKYGLTATKPTNKHEELINEGLIGPVIAKMTVQKGIEIGIIAKPIINLMPVPFRSEITQACNNKYNNFYHYGIVENRRRNITIVDIVIKNIKNKETSLIIIEKTEHGRILKKMLKRKNIDAPFIYGQTKQDIREDAKNKLNSGKTKVIICSKVWREGINIPTLNNIINACGMKEEKMVIQAVGRGLRTTKDKKVIKVYDFLDPYKYLAEHTIARIQVYQRQGWL